MDATQRRMIAVAVVVSCFAVGMAGLLNYFKYRATANRLVAERLVVTGKSVENIIQNALELGLQFSDIATLPTALDRERATDELIRGIDVFDTDGALLYSTDRLRASRPVPASWLTAARKAGTDNWVVDDEPEGAAGISLRNNFGLTVGYLALRYSTEMVREDAMKVARHLALATLGIFALSSLLASLAVVGVMRRLNHDVGVLQAALAQGDNPGAAALAARGPFGAALKRFLSTTREAEAEIGDLRARLHRGVKA